MLQELPRQLNVRESGLQVNLVTFPIAYKEFGLPEHCESLDTLPSKDLLRKFYDAVEKLQEPLERFLGEQETPPSCIISDKCLFWTSETAKKFKIPWVLFHGMCCFNLLSSHNLHLHSPHLSVSSDSEPFTIPAMPHKVEIARSQLSGAFRKQANRDDVRREKMREAESEAYGVIVNSFQELEPGYAEAYAEAIKKKVGVRVGVEVPVRWGDEERVGVSVKKHSVVNAIKLLMHDDGNEDADFLGRRKRIQELSVMAREAVELKGSSSTNVSLLIQDVLEKLCLE